MATRGMIDTMLAKPPGPRTFTDAATLRRPTLREGCRVKDLFAAGSGGGTDRIGHATLPDRPAGATAG